MQSNNAYDPKNIEEKWIKNWEDTQVHKTEVDESKTKLHVLDMFPYPSGEGLHAGHAKTFGGSDIYTRFKRMQGFNVLHATGWDAFGLPAEQFALKNKVNPKISTAKNVATYEKQMKMLGLSYDWDRTVNTTDPKFYKWTQWAFKQMFKAGLTFESNEPINWCPSCKTGLANEDLEDGKCERCGSVVEKKPLRQWVIRITEYAEKLIDGLKDLDWKESTKDMQRNWVGKSEGAEITFKIHFEMTKPDGTKHGVGEIPVFTTRPDTLFGATYMVLAPEHLWVTLAVDDNHDVLFNKEEVKKYVEEAKNKTEIERTALGKEKSGVKVEGVYAENPVNGAKIPVYVADYVLGNYGTGAIMAVPAHDERDFEFAQKYNIPVVQVVEEIKVTEGNRDDAFRPGEQIVHRDVVAVCVRNPKTNEYLTLSWKGQNMKGVVTGGLEGESVEDAARREVHEETGYKNLKLIKVSNFRKHTKFFHRIKKVNRHATWSFAFFELIDEEKDEIAEEESAMHEVHWTKESDLLKTLTVPEAIWAYEFSKSDSPLYTEAGILSNSGEFDGMDSEEAKKKITEHANGKLVTKYKLKDWVFARQRYWGEPFPIVFDENHKPYVVADSELPVVLPDVESYEPTGTGEGPLADIKDWVEVKGEINSDGEFISNPNGKTFYRETNTMPQWAGSSWYWLRYMDPHNDNRLVGEKEEKYWSSNGAPVDMYIGGMEHATRHLIYGRFWNQFLYDQGVLSASEPFKRLETVGLVLGHDGTKMSKRLGNVVNPDDIVNKFGADTLRTYIAFASAFGDSFNWDEKAIIGPRRFIERVWGLQYKLKDGGSEELETVLHQTIKKVGEDYEKLQFNTAIAQMMIFVNAVEREGTISEENYKILLKLLAPICPFVTEELWNVLGGKESIHKTSWPTYDPKKIINKNVNIAVQINGKLRDVFEAPVDTPDEIVVEMAKKTEGYKKWVGEITPKKVIVVKNKVVNIVA